MTIDNMQYPIGQFEPKPFSDELKEGLLQELAALPLNMEAAVQGLNAEQLHTPYREGGGSPAQFVHHMADSSLNYYARCKFALAQDNPMVTPFDQDAWIKLNDSTTSVDVSLSLLHALHKKWETLLSGLSEQDWMRTVVYPDREKPIKLWNLLLVSVWHGKHHTQQIVTFRESKNW